MTAAEQAPGRSGLLEQLMAIVRPEFRTEVYIPARTTLSSPRECTVAGCDRTTVSPQRGLCNAHAIRWRRAWTPAVQEFLADPGPPVRGRRPLAACRVDGCGYGGTAGNGLCSRHRDRWDRAGKPDLATWDAPDLARSGIWRPSADCRSATLWAENPEKLFCKNHDDRWRRTGRPDPGRFIADCELTGTAHIDLRGLASAPEDGDSSTPCSAGHDAQAPHRPAGLVMQAVRQARAAGVTSLLDRSEQQWRHCAGFPVRRARAVPARCPRRRGIPARRDRLGSRVSPGRLAAEQAAGHHRPIRPAPPARPAAVRPHHPALAA